MIEKNSYPENATRKWITAKNKLEWQTFVQLNALDQTNPDFVHAVLSAVEAASFQTPHDTSIIPEEIGKYINTNNTLIQLAEMIQNDPTEKRIAFWINLLCSEEIGNTISEKEAGVEEGVNRKRERIFGILQSEVPESLRTSAENLSRDIQETIYAAYVEDDRSVEHLQRVLKALGYALGCTSRGTYGYMRAFLEQIENLDRHGVPKNRTTE